VSGLTFTGSYWLSAVPFAAGIACIEKMKRLKLPQVLHEKGTKLTQGLVEAAKKHGFTLHASGMPALFYLRLADIGLDGKTPALMLHQRWIAEMVKRGIYLTNHHNHFLNYSLSDEDIQTTLDVADEAFSVL
jgi:glutamate-1-semialdehyde 2,1-aminomutase